ncbi:hypothetical protein P691DRAFT_767790 [Macrolepiota fuliginosa MF-IS2]|uniref:Uncharacterized protein n=1 Tax=Macrolepiota fuliginosa MF-IS2 TaxID=1400762 RepID=A0A9P6BUN9_9AGAR|nr:hypothetical protein P691DRAFT_767790 [Macrolepiota fuliginosa MF-IS2]
MEEFLQKWTDQRAEKLGGDWDGTQEVEQGLVAFQTLLEYHTDIAFDFFEAWSMRNIFAIPPDLPIVLPHQENLDLTAMAECEQGLTDEIEQLRRKIDVQRKLRRVLNPQLSVLQHPSLDTLATLPHKFDTMYDTCSSVEPLDAATISTLTQVELSEPGKRSWESTKSGYLKWATERLLAKAKEGEGGSGEVTNLVDRMEQVGRAERLRKAIEVTENTVVALTELICCLVEFFFILRMWRFAERKQWAILAFIPYFGAVVFNLVYLRGMFEHPCFPDTLVNFIWLYLSYAFKVLSDGVIAGTMIWLLYHRSRGTRERGKTIRVIRNLMYWSFSTGLILWWGSKFPSFNPR